MASSHLPEDFIRALSRLVFACIASDQMTLRLFDPVTGTLASYLLVKVLDDDLVYRARLPSDKVPLQAVLDDLVERLKAVVREETPVFAQRTRRASQFKLRLPSDAQTVGATLRNSQVSPSPSPPGKTVRGHRRCDGRVLVSRRTMNVGPPCSADPAISAKPPGTGGSDNESWHTCGAIDSTAKSNKRSPPRLEDIVLGRTDGRVGKLFTGVSAVAAAQDGGHVDALLPVHLAEGSPRLVPRTPTKTAAPILGAHHEDLPPGAVDFPPFLVTSTPKAVARHRMSLALRQAKDNNAPPEKDRSRCTTLPARSKPSFDLGVFDPETVSAAVAESNRRASIGVALPRASRNWERLRPAGR